MSGSVSIFAPPAPANDNRRPPTRAEFYRGLGERLQLLRLALDQSPAAMAAVAGVTVRTWKKWEKGGPPYGAWPMVELADWCGVSLDWLFHDSEVAMPRGLMRQIRIARWRFNAEARPRGNLTIGGTA